MRWLGLAHLATLAGMSGLSFDGLKADYAAQWAAMRIKPGVMPIIDKAVRRLLTPERKAVYQAITDKTNVPIVVLAAIHEREASGDMSCSLAQGDPWNHVSRHEPRGRGPFTSFEAAALDALHIDGLDEIGKGNWTVERVCYEQEIYNGMGYRKHGLPSPYLWGDTNLQKPGKFIADGKFDPSVWDTQIGVMPLIARMLALNPELTLDGLETDRHPSVAPASVADTALTTLQIQRDLNVLGFGPVAEDDDYGRATKNAVRAFQQSLDLQDDGIVGPNTSKALAAAMAAKVPA